MFEYKEPVSADGETVKIVMEEWSKEHAKVLYLMSKYAVCAVTAEDTESWIRQIPLLVLLYEGITAGKLDYDYAPSSTLITQDGRSR